MEYLGRFHCVCILGSIGALGGGGHCDNFCINQFFYILNFFLFIPAILLNIPALNCLNYILHLNRDLTR